MSHQKTNAREGMDRRWRWGAVGVAVVLGGVAMAMLRSRGLQSQAAQSAPSESRTTPTNTAPSKAAAQDTSRMEVAHAVMVTVELDFGGKPPSIAEALTQIERRYQPLDGVGRTFAILDAYGEPTPAGKLHMSMHVSTEKPGGASLVFKRTGEVLWTSQIVPSTNAQEAKAKGLVILLDAGAGRAVTVDGSNNPRSILDAKIKEMGIPVGDFWTEGSEREVTFLYSACGCPVKVLAMRVGDKTIRTGNLPVIFPDDPAAVGVIKRLMRWD